MTSVDRALRSFIWIAKREKIAYWNDTIDIDVSCCIGTTDFLSCSRRPRQSYARRLDSRLKKQKKMLSDM